MAFAYRKNEYTIPRGRVFFNPLIDDGAGGERYAGEIELGNCPSFGISVETEKAEHFSSQTGLREKDASVVLEVKRSGKLTCDNMSGDNVALFLSGGVSIVSQSAVAVAATQDIKVLRQRFYQIGLSDARPAGVRKLSDVSISPKAGGTPYVLGTDYAIDLERGRLQILSTGIADDTEITVSYKAAASTWQRIQSGANGELLGALRVISDNATGAKRDYYMPRSSLVPSGDLPVIADGTDFAQMQFDADILKPANGEAIYVDGLPLAA